MDTILVFRMKRYDSWATKQAVLTFAAERRGWRLQIVDQPATKSAIRKLLEFWRPRGVVIVETPSGGRSLPRDVFLGIPAVFMDCDPKFMTKGIPNVLHDTHAICESAVRTLLDIGCTTVGYVGWFERTFWCEDKRSACRDTLAFLGKPFYEMIPTPDELRNVALLDRHLVSWLQSLPLPCGILPANDTIAEQVLSAATACKMSVPDDLAILSVGSNATVCERTSPTISSFTVNYQAVAETVFSILEERRKLSGKVLVKSFRFVQRQSTRRLKRKDPDVEAAIEQIRKDACNGLKPTDVFRTFKCSLRSAEMRFKKVTGHSIWDEISNVRFERLFELLSDPKLSISTISDLCGFPSSLVLYRQFKAKTGLTPLQWRKSKSSCRTPQ